MEDIEEVINEDEIICQVMLDHPDLWNDLDYNEYTIKDKLEKNPYQYQQYRLLWLKEKHKLKRIEILKDEYIGKLYDNLRFHGDKKLGKQEVERYYIPKDEKAVKFMKLYMRQEIRTGVYEEISNAFKTQGFAMHTYIKNLEL